MSRPDRGVHGDPLREDRWQPVRGGLVNLYKYENQVFRYERGHLLLRGDNGSGKSRVLALQLPFLLDGEIQPARVEPDRDSAKRMEWNLLMDQHDSRTGYTWIEFGRRDADGAARYLILGCGLSARKGAGAPKRWFFLTPWRVGHDLQLLSENRVPLTQRQLHERLQELGDGAIHEKAAAYRNAVDAALFKLGSRYRPLIDLLIQLRQPQLARKMDEDVLSKALSEALAPVSPTLVTQVAESFQGLDTDRQLTEQSRETLESVDTFREGYEQYLATAIRRLCDVVRDRHNTYERAGRELRQLESDQQANRQALEDGRREHAEAKEAQAALQSTIHVLRDSPEMRSQRELQRLQQIAEQHRKDADLAEADWDKRRRDLEGAQSETAGREAEAATARTELVAAHAALETVHAAVALGSESLFDLATTDAEPARRQLDKLLERRRRGIRRLEERNAELAARHRQHQSDRDQADKDQAAVSVAEDRAARSQADLEQAVESFSHAVHQWERSLTELGPAYFGRGQDWGESLAGWLAERAGEPPFAAAVHRAVQQASQTLATERASLASEREGVEAEHASLAAELSDLRAGRQLEPPPRHTRAARPADRPGAPFWRCFDFQETVPESERAGWEAGLEAAGLLDAWILPGGGLASASETDDFLGLVEGPELETPASLAAVLRPVDASDPALVRLLRRIGNHPESAAHCWVARSGQWANGPHHGAWRKADLAYLGHDAREAARRRRVEILEADLRHLDNELRRIDQAQAELSRRGQQLRDERAAAPREEQAIECMVRLEGDREQVQARKLELTEAMERADVSRRAHEEAKEQRDTDAADLGLATVAAPEALAKFRDQVEALKVRATSFWPGWDRSLRADRESARAIEREQAATTEEAAARRRHHDQRERAGRSRAEAETLKATLGTDVRDVLERLRQAEAGLQAAETRVEICDRTVRDLEIQAAGLAERRRGAEEMRAGADAEREGVVNRMEVFVDARLFAEVDPTAQPERSSFSATAAVELARRLEKQLRAHPSDDDTWRRYQSDIVQRFSQLQDHLGLRGMVPRLHSIDESDVKVIQCDFQGRSRSIRELSHVLRDELVSRERIFEEREREIIQNHLIGEAAHELQTRIRDGEEWVARINEQLARAHTSSGIRLKFDWGVADSHDEELKEVRRLFRGTAATWTPAERERIGRFLQARIDAAQKEDDTATWREFLRRALDYRDWHRFGILTRRGGQDNWRKLTKRSFGTGSGGEKALTLTLPQFAAAAAHYESADPAAPRLILLDEVFAGIDAPSRARLMGLIETFDLDYVMTSQLEWGTYPEVSGLAIYLLSSRPDSPAVAVTRWVWNGREKIRDSAVDDGDG